jgi:hypothetical protein
MQQQIERLYEQQEIRIVDLLDHMFTEICSSDIPVAQLQGMMIEDVIHADKMYWSDKMHDMYGQMRAHATIKDQLSAILNKKINPLSLGEGDPDQT